MKFIGQHTKTMFNSKGQAETTLLVPNFRSIALLDELEPNVDYVVEIKKARSKRSIQSNRYLWYLLHELEKQTKELAMDWYIKALIETGAKVDYVWGTEETEITLKKTFRAVQKVKPHKIKNSDGWLYRVIVGSSKFNSKEMNLLIETIQVYCNELNINYEVDIYSNL